MKTLVSIGYHTGELAWGRYVRDQYIARGLLGHRELRFHEVKNAKHWTGNVDRGVITELDEICREEGRDLLIDIHCGFSAERSGQIHFKYVSVDQVMLERASSTGWLKANDARPYDNHFFPPNWAYIDPYFTFFEYARNDLVVQRALHTTLKFINSVHDLHQGPQKMRQTA